MTVDREQALTWQDSGGEMVVSRADYDALLAELDEAREDAEDWKAIAAGPSSVRLREAEARLAKVPALVEALNRIADAGTGVPDWRSMADCARVALAAWESE